MSQEFKFAGMDGADEVTISSFHVQVGQDVKKGDNLFDVEADKASETITATFDGKVAKLNFQAGDSIKAGDVVISFGNGVTTVAQEAKTEVNNKKEEAKPVVNEVKNQENLVNNFKNEQVLATPLARKIASELKVDISAIQGTGPNGRVLKTDIEQFAANGQGTQKVTATVNSSVNTQVSVQAASLINVAKIESFGPVEHLPLSGIRKAVATAMSTSVYTAPHVSLMIDVDATNLINLRSVLKEQAIKPENGEIKLTFMPFFIKAVAKALSEERFKLLNSTMNTAGNEILVKKYYNIGMAADTDKGLVVPVIKDADKLSLFETAKKVNELAVKSRKGLLKADDMQGGTFTITNFGSAGLKFGTPVINYPEVAILGLGALETKAVLIANEVVFHQFFPLSISIDHRVIDGAPAGYFMQRIKEFLENPALILA